MKKRKKKKAQCNVKDGKKVINKKSNEKVKFKK